MNPPDIATVGDLRTSGYTPCSVKDELRRNLIARLRSGDELFPGIIGYDQTVIPQVVNAILSRHDMLFLGLRGQAKTRMLRMLPGLLDEWIPVLAGVQLNDDPVAPRTREGRRLLEQQGDRAPVRWVHRSSRYLEKLATPDVTIADLIGEIDLVRHAEGKYLSDESTMHFGLVPRSNRGIFAINELPDLSPRIQVGLFNVLEERDVQIRGFPLRLDLDVCLVFSANPEDYTNRGRIVTPLKDRIGSVIRTHYPATVEDGLRIARENAWTDRLAGPSGSGVRVEVPGFLARIIEEVVRQARSSPHVSQSSGVSVRTSIANVESVVSNAERRGIRTAERKVVARISDLHAIIASSRGKIELTLAEDDATEEKLIRSLLGEAVKTVFNGVARVEQLESVVEQFKNNLTFPCGDEIPAEEFVANMKAVKGLTAAAQMVAGALEVDASEPGMLASVGELVLEGLYVNDRLSKFTSKGQPYFRR